IRGEVVAVLGDVQLGPDAVVHGEVVCVGGTVNRAPGAQVYRGVQQVGPFPVVGDGLKGLRTWFRTCLMLARPLAFNAEVLWAWGVAGAFVGVYLLIALMFNRPVIACAETLEKRDRKSTRLNSSHVKISYAVFCLKKKTIQHR